MIGCSGCVWQVIVLGLIYEMSPNGRLVGWGVCGMCLCWDWFVRCDKMGDWLFRVCVWCVLVLGLVYEVS